MSHNTPGGQMPPQPPVSYTTPDAGPPQQAAGQPPPGAADMPPGGWQQPQPPKKNWFARHKVLTALLIVVVLIVIGVAIGGGSGSDDADEVGGSEQGDDLAVDDDAEPDGEAEEAGEAEPADDDEAEPADEAEPSLGDAVRDGKFEFVVSEVETGVAEVGDDFMAEEAQGQFVLVHMSIANIGDESQSLADDAQLLVDSDGREHSSDSMAGLVIDDNDTFFNEINPGNEVEGVVVFDIPADAEPAGLELHDSHFSGGVSLSLE